MRPTLGLGPCPDCGKDEWTHDPGTGKSRCDVCGWSTLGLMWKPMTPGPARGTYAQGGFITGPQTPVPAGSLPGMSGAGMRALEEMMRRPVRYWMPGLVGPGLDEDDGLELKDARPVRQGKVKGLDGSNRLLRWIIAARPPAYGAGFALTVTNLLGWSAVHPLLPPGLLVAPLLCAWALMAVTWLGLRVGTGPEAARAYAAAVLPPGGHWRSRVRWWWLRQRPVRWWLDRRLLRKSRRVWRLARRDAARARKGR